MRKRARRTPSVERLEVGLPVEAVGPPKPGDDVVRRRVGERDQDFAITTVARQRADRRRWRAGRARLRPCHDRGRRTAGLSCRFLLRWLARLVIIVLDVAAAAGDHSLPLRRPGSGITMPKPPPPNPGCARPPPPPPSLPPGYLPRPCVSFSQPDLVRPACVWRSGNSFPRAPCSRKGSRQPARAAARRETGMTRSSTLSLCASLHSTSTASVIRTPRRCSSHASLQFVLRHPRRQRLGRQAYAPDAARLRTVDHLGSEPRPALP